MRVTTAQPRWACQTGGSPSRGTQISPFGTLRKPTELALSAPNGSYRRGDIGAADYLRDERVLALPPLLTGWVRRQVPQLLALALASPGSAGEGSGMVGASDITSMAGYPRARVFVSCQCVVAWRPSRRPAAARMNVPMQTDRDGALCSPGQGPRRPGQLRAHQIRRKIVRASQACRRTCSMRMSAPQAFAVGERFGGDVDVIAVGSPAQGAP
jgi:hypothetical protein